MISKRQILDQFVKPGVKRGDHHPLAPRHAVYLRAYASGGARFAHLFRETWDRLPLNARRAILKLWKSNDVRSTGVLLSPDIEYASDWSGKEPGDVGYVRCGGHIIRFASRRVEKMPDDVVQDLIAHELAHVYQWASGEDMHVLDSFDIEYFADEIMDYWGFDPESIDRWGLETGVTKLVDVDKLTESQKKRLRARAKRAGRGLGLYI